MLRYHKNTGGKFENVTKDAILADDKPIVLFLGGLLHFNNLQTGPSLSKILDKLTNAQVTNLPTYMVTRSGDTDVGRTAGDMNAFENEETISAEARALVHDLILPPSLTTAPPQTIRRHLSRFNVIGYSYGTSLVQQIETVLYEHLQKRGLSMEETARTMEGFAAVNIGPVARPKIWNEEGLTTRFNRHSNHTTPMRSLFSQYFFLRRFDKISNDSLHDKLTHDMSNDRAIHIFGSTSSIYICDNTGDDRLRRLGFKALSSGYNFPFITYNMDHEGHDLRLYTNTLTRSELMMTYPSMGTAAHLVAACHHMIGESETAMAGGKRDLTPPIKELCNSDNTSEIEKRINALHKHFERVVSEYSLSTIQHGRTIIQNELDEPHEISTVRLNQEIPAPQAPA